MTYPVEPGGKLPLLTACALIGLVTASVVMGLMGDLLIVPFAIMAGCIVGIPGYLAVALLYVSFERGFETRPTLWCAAATVVGVVVSITALLIYPLMLGEGEDFAWRDAGHLFLSLWTSEVFLPVAVATTVSAVLFRWWGFAKTAPA